MNILHVKYHALIEEQFFFYPQVCIENKYLIDKSKFGLT